MKLKKLSVIFLFCYTTSIAQINLEHTFSGYVSWSSSIYTDPSSIIPSNSYYITSITANAYNEKIYNSNYSLISDESYIFTPPTNYKVSSVIKTKNLFDSDNEFEFLVTFVRTDNTYDDTRSKLKLLDEAGNVIKDFGTSYMFQTPSYLHIANNQFRYLLIKFLSDGTYSSEIYSVPGTVPTSLKSSTVLSSSIPYPNPASSSIVIPYNLKTNDNQMMNVYNLNGQLVETILLDISADKIILNISNYNRGIYTYVINGISNKFIVN